MGLFQDGAGSPVRGRTAEEAFAIELTDRQLTIIELVKNHAPITGEQIAENLGVSRPTLRSDLSVLVMLGIIDAKPKVGYFPGKSMLPDGAAIERLVAWKVKDIMGRPVAVREEGLVKDAVIQLFVENTGLLVVVDGEGDLAGVVTTKDLLKVTVGNPNADQIPISMVMTRLPRVVTVQPEDSVMEAAKRMIDHQISGLPVVQAKADSGDDTSFEVVGRITKTHILQVLLEPSMEQ